jgi:hypothetical protein
MVSDSYFEAVLVDRDMAEMILVPWDSGQIDETQAVTAWPLVCG